MTNANALDNVIGSTVYGPGDEKIGKAKQLYLNNETGSPTWVSVSTGLLSSDSLVPLAGAKLSDDSLVVTVSKSAVKDAPHLDNDGQIDADQESELFRYYGIDSTRSGWDDHGRQDAANTPGTTSGQRTTDADVTGKHAAGTGVAGTAAAGTAAAGTQDRARTEADFDSTDTQTARTADADRIDRDPALVRSEEQLNVGTESTATGTARLRKYVVTEQQSVSVPVTREEVRVVREPITDANAVRNTDLGDDSREVTLHEDKVHVSKESVPVEQVRLDVDQVRDEKTVTDEVRKERIDIDGVDGEGTARGVDGESTARDTRR